MLIDAVGKSAKFTHTASSKILLETSSNNSHLLLLQHLRFSGYHKRFTWQVHTVTAGSRLQTLDDRNMAMLFNLLAGQYLCSRALWMCTESEGAERCLQHQLFYPRTKPLLNPVFPLRKEPENTWSVSSAEGLHWFSSADKAISTVLGNRCKRTVAAFSHSPTLQLDPL